MKNLARSPHQQNRALLVFAFLAITGIFTCVHSTGAQEGAVTAKVQIVKENSASPEPDASSVVVWLQPLDGAAAAPAASQPTPQIVQHNKAFEPRLTVVEVGAVVQFPNKDPFLHNVFSVFNGKRFDLGLYESGSSKSVRFDHPGISFLFCNIHPEMSGIVIVVESPYFAISDRAGRVTFANVPDGRYTMHVWYEKSTPESLKSRDRVITVSGSSRTLETVQFVEDPHFTLAHKNLYGQDYVPPASNSGYGHH
jgi:plastocyanin